jgi:hypothetical protein
MRAHLSQNELINALKDHQGLIPVGIGSDRTLWMDLGEYHFYEGFFHRSLDVFHALKKGKVFSFTTDITVLEDQRILTEYIYPSGFIFHAGRCGSTVLAKVLARSTGNLVISEAGPHNLIWRSLGKNTGTVPEINEGNKAIYRNLVLAMARKRVKEHRNHFIKFTSYNIHFFDFIRAVFPEVPAIFLTRDVVSSFAARPPAWLTQPDPYIRGILAGAGSTIGIKEAVEGFFEKAEGKLPHMDYELLVPENLRDILAHFNLYPGEKELNLMRSQFLYDSKAEFNRKKFPS